MRSRYPDLLCHPTRPPKSARICFQTGNPAGRRHDRQEPVTFCRRDFFAHAMKYPVIDTKKTGEKIRSVISGSGYSVRDVADFLGTDTASVYRYMRGDVLPSTDRLLALSVLLGVPTWAGLLAYS